MIPPSFLSNFCPRHLRASKVASAHLPFYLSSPKERKGRSVTLLQHSRLRVALVHSTRGTRQTWGSFSSSISAVVASTLWRTQELRGPLCLCRCFSQAIIAFRFSLALCTVPCASALAPLSVAEKQELRLCFAWLNMLSVAPIAAQLHRRARTVM